MRILITGSRDWTDQRLIEAAIVEAMVFGKDWPRIVPTIIHGGARGADSMADGVAIRRNLKQEAHPADWGQYGKRAGFIRNAEMVKSGADICLAFIKNESKGATMCADLAEKAGIPTRRYIA